MAKKAFLLISLVVVLGLVGSAAAGNKTWLGTDNNWFNPNNWDPTGVPVGSLSASPLDEGDIVHINGGLSNYPVINTTDPCAWCTKVQLGTVADSGDAYLTIEDGGELTVRSYNTDTGNQTIVLGKANGTHGILTMTGGTINMAEGEQFEIGGRSHEGRGTFDMTGGQLNNGDIRLPGYGGMGTSVVNLDGGVIDCNEFEWSSDTKCGTLNLYSGTIICDYLGFHSGGYFNLYGGVIDSYTWKMYGNFGLFDIYDGVWYNYTQGLPGGDQHRMTYEVRYYAGMDPPQIVAYGGRGTVAIEWTNMNHPDPNQRIAEEDLVNLMPDPNGEIYWWVRADFDGNAAYWPNPADGFGGADPDQTLSWYPAYNGNAASHDLYFSEDFNDVNDANAVSHPNCVYVAGLPLDQNYIAREDYWTTGSFEMGNTYYWRIDEVNGTDIWKGTVWSFSISYVGIDDFESYSGHTDLRASWKDRSNQADPKTYCYAYLKNDPAKDSQSMYLDCWNGLSPRYGEVRHEFDSFQNWSPAATDARFLAFSYYGKADNPEDYIYIRLEDSLGNDAVQRVTDGALTQREEWTELFFALNEFTSPDVVDLGRISKIIIGVGPQPPVSVGSGTVKIWVDNVRLHPAGGYPLYKWVVVNESEGSTQVTELGPTSDDFTVELYSQPTDDVTITIDPNTNGEDIYLGSELPGEAVTLVFTDADWNIPQDVNVWAVNDYYSEGTEIAELAFSVSSSDPDYNQGYIRTLYVTVIDNDTGDVVIVESGGSTEVSEQGPTSDQYTMVLASQPTADVNIYLQDLSDPDQVTILPTSLVFTTGDWDTPKTVTVTAIDDNVWEDGSHSTMIGHTISTDDTTYQQVDIGNVSVIVQDNDKPDVHIVPVVMLIDPSITSEIRTSLPDSISAVVQGSTYYVEIWASDVDNINTGLTSVYVDVSFCEQASASDVYHGTIFITFPGGTIQAGGVDDFGGSALPSGGGIEPEWVRVGWIKMSGAVVENCTISLLPSFSGVAALDRGLIPWDQIDLGSLDLEVTPAAKSYDLDGDDFIGPGDLSLFAGSWLKRIPPADDTHDFDCDGFVGVGDLSWFATGWGKYTDDPTILYPACPGAGGDMLAANNTTTSSTSRYAPMRFVAAVDMLEVSADIAFELVVLDAPSASDTTTTLPTSLNAITSGQTCYLEVWVSDIGGYDTGVIAAYVDANFPADVVTITNISHGSIFTMFTDPCVVSGLIDELGGSTLSEGVGKEPQWARVAVVEMHADAALPSVTFTLSPSSTGVSAYGRGQISWDDIFLGTVTVNDYDINGDHKVTFIDFAILGDQWFQAPGVPSADITPNGGDGVVDFLDLNILTEHWLEGVAP